MRERALELARLQWHIGTIDLRPVEQSQLAAYSARRGYTLEQAARVAHQPLSRLGGSFDEAVISAFVPR